MHRYLSTNIRVYSVKSADVGPNVAEAARNNEYRILSVIAATDPHLFCVSEATGKQVPLRPVWVPQWEPN